MTALARSAVLLLACALPLATGAAPKQFSVHFVLEAKGMTVGKTRWSLVSTRDGRLVYEARSRAAGLVSLFRDDRILERSELRYRGGARLRPLRYRYERTGKKSKELTIDFDWENRVAHNKSGERTWRIDIPSGTLDKLSYILALMRDLEKGKREVAYPVAARGKLKTYHLKVVGRERLDTALGPLETIEVRRVREDDNDRETSAWFAPSLHYLPVKIVHREDDGTVISLHIRSIDGRVEELARDVR